MVMVAVRCNSKWERLTRQSLRFIPSFLSALQPAKSQQLSTTASDCVTVEALTVESCDYSAKCHFPKKEGAKTLRFWLSITRPSLQLVFELRWEYYSLDNEQYYKNVKTYHLSQLRISSKVKIKIYLIIHYYMEFF